MAESNIRNNPINISINNQQQTLRLNSKVIAGIVQQVLRSQKISQANLSISFISRQKIQALNKQFLGRSYATDVLAFNLSDDKKILVGDVIVSTDAAVKYAQIHQLAVAEELVLYVVHGLLHLLGYDDHAVKDIARMRRKEQEVLARIQRSIPSVISPKSK